MKIKKLGQTNKHIFNLLLVLLILFSISISLTGADKNLFFDLSLSAFSNSDEEFKKIYMDSMWVPEIGIGYLFSNNFYVRTNLSLISINGQTPKWLYDVKMKQKRLSLNGGYKHKLSKKISLSGEVGFVFLMYDEQITQLNYINKDNSPGFKTGIDCQYSVNSIFRLIINLDYSIINKSIDAGSKRFGGIKAGLGIRFFL